MTTLTEDNELIFTTNKAWFDAKIPLQYTLALHTTNIYEAQDIKLQILQALQENPKLKEQLFRTQDQLSKADENAYNNWKTEYEKLKAEIEELKTKAERYDRITDYERVNDPRLFASEAVHKLEQENESLRQLKNELIDIFRGTETSEYKLSGEFVKHLNDRLEKIKQQLLKGDNS